MTELLPIVYYAPLIYTKVNDDECVLKPSQPNMQMSGIENVYACNM